MGCFNIVRGEKMTTPPTVKVQRTYSKTIVIIAVIVSLLIPTFGMYAYYQPQVTQLQNDRYHLSLQLNQTISQLDQTNNQLSAANSKIQSLQSENSQLQSQVSSLQSQVSSLQSQNSQLQSQLSSAQSQLSSLEAINLVADGYWNSSCIFGLCIGQVSALAVANTGTTTAYNVQLTVTFYSGMNDQGSQLCQATYVVGAVAGQSIVTVSPNDLPSCSYIGFPAQSATVSASHS
jgi:regulator of replication initiation timing